MLKLRRIQISMLPSFHVIKVYYMQGRAMPWLRVLVTGLSPQMPKFVPRSVHVGSVVDKVERGQVLYPSSLVFSWKYNSSWLSILIYVGMNKRPVSGCT
jgi:hypothetical protein